MTHHNEIYAALILRVFLGVLFFAQGYDKIVKVKIRGVVETCEHPFITNHVPRWMLVLSAWFTSYVELICGFLLIIGFVKYYALYLLGIDLLMVTVAFCIIEPMWDMRAVFPRMLLLLIALMIPYQWDIISVDWYWSLFRRLQSLGLFS